jgi:hypothetical protein
MHMDWEHGVVEETVTTRGHSLERLEDWEVPPSRRISAPGKNRWREGRIGVRESAGIGASASAEGAIGGSAASFEKSDSAKIAGEGVEESGGEAYRGIQDLKRKILYYLNHTSERLQIAQAGRSTALRRHQE